MKRFPLGQVVVTPGAKSVMAPDLQPLYDVIDRHQSGDWGDLPEEDKKENELSVNEGYRILSAYTVNDEKVWVITEADRSVTTVLLPGEY